MASAPAATPSATVPPVVGATAPPLQATDISFAAGNYTASVLAGGSSGAVVDGTGTAAVLGSSILLAGMDFDTANSLLLFTDGRFNQLRTLDPATAQVTRIVGDPFGLSQATPPVAGETYLAQPDGTVYDAKRKVVYISDGGNNRLLRLAREGNTLGEADGTVDVLIAASKWSGVNPAGMALAGDTLYVDCIGTQAIFSIDLTAATPATVAAISLAAQPAIPASMDVVEPRSHVNLGRAAGMVVSTDGKTLFIADTQFNVIRAVDLSSASGQVSIFAGTLDAGDVDGARKVASFNQPVALAVDKDNLYVGEVKNFRVRAISLTTQQVSTVLGGQQAGSTTGNKTSAAFVSVTGLNAQLKADKSLQTLFVYDGGNASTGGRILAIQP